MHSYKITNLPKFLNHTTLKKLIQEHVDSDFKMVYKHKSDYAFIKFESEITITEMKIRNNNCKITECKNRESTANHDIEIADIRDRVTPLWKHSYDEQVNMKKEAIVKFYNREIDYYGTTNFYRNNCQFTFGFCDGKPWVGFKGSGANNKVYDVENCVNVSDTMKDRLREINNLLKGKDNLVYDTIAKTGYLRGLMIRGTESEQIALLQVHGNVGKNETDMYKHLDPKILDVIGQMEFKNLYIQFYDKQFNGFVPSVLFKFNGDKTIIQKVKDYKFVISFFNFFQINTEIADKICEVIVSKKPKNSVLYDLCCGSGFFGIMLHKHFEKIHGIELNGDAVAIGLYNISNNEVDNSNIIEGDVTAIDLDVGTALLDPPRAGVNKKFIAKLRKSDINEIFYISCDYKQSYQNILDLCKETSNQYQNKPFTIQSVDAFDMFPNTDKSEVLIHLTR